MAKKRRNARRAARRQPSVKFVQYPRVANILVGLAIAILAVNAIAMIFLKDQVLQALKDAGFAISQSSLALMGLMWVLIALFAWSINRTIKEKPNKTSMWELFILSIVCIFSGRLESGILILIASVIYLVKAKKRK